MAEAVVVSPAPSIERRVSQDRLFYSGMAIVTALAVLAGFAQTYYLPLAGSGQLTTITGREVSGLIHAHGALFSLWVLLFVMQTSLIATHHVRVHQRMGIAGAVLAAAMIVAGVTLSISGAAAGVAPAGVSALSFLAIPLGDMVMFAGFIAAALWTRRNREAHKRLMLLAYISLLAAPMARLPGVLPLGPFAFYGLALVFLAICVVYDLVMRRRVHRTYVWGGGLLALSVPGRLMLSETAAWQAFAHLLTQ